MKKEGPSNIELPHPLSSFSLPREFFEPTNTIVAALEQAGIEVRNRSIAEIFCVPGRNARALVTYTKEFIGFDHRPIALEYLKKEMPGVPFDVLPAGSIKENHYDVIVISPDKSNWSVASLPYYLSLAIRLGHADSHIVVSIPFKTIPLERFDSFKEFTRYEGLGYLLYTSRTKNVVLSGN